MAYQQAGWLCSSCSSFAAFGICRARNRAGKVFVNFETILNGEPVVLKDLFKTLFNNHLIARVDFGLDSMNVKTGRCMKTSLNRRVILVLLLKTSSCKIANKVRDTSWYFRRCLERTRKEGGWKVLSWRAKPPKSPLTIITVKPSSSSYITIRTPMFREVFLSPAICTFGRRQRYDRINPSRIWKRDCTFH